MSNSLYYNSSIFLNLVGVFGGIFIGNLGIVFDILGGFGMSFLCFIWPGVFYLKALK
jgi:hypothetical protein